jgi:ABC-type polysaccharide/polyol phosphate export permease
MATGIVFWNLINQMTLDGADVFVSASHVLRQTAIPLPLFIWRAAWRNFLIFCHQAPVLLGIGLWFHNLFQMHLPEALAGLALLIVNVSWISFCAAIVCARFRDLQQVLVSIMQLLFFLSPVIWFPSGTKGGDGIVQINPIFHMLNVTRNPIIGQSIDIHSFIYLIVMAILGWILTFFLFTTVRRRIVHYI